MRIEPTPTPPLQRPLPPVNDVAQARRTELLRLIAEEASSLTQAEVEPEKGRWIDIRC